MFLRYTTVLILASFTRDHFLLIDWIFSSPLLNSLAVLANFLLLIPLAALLKEFCLFVCKSIVNSCGQFPFCFPLPEILLTLC